MADFCRQCSLEQFGEDFRDLADLCAPGKRCGVICEGCKHEGVCYVNHEGVCLVRLLKDSDAMGA